MMRWIVRTAVMFRLLLLLTAAAVVLLGVLRLRDTPVDVLPEFSPTSVQVQTEALGLSAAEVEQLITVPLEADLLNGVPWLATIRSESVPGLSSILLVFEPGTDPLRARQVVNERITQARALPNVSKPPVMLQPLSSGSRVMMIGLSPRSLSLIETSVLARWTIRPRLMSVPGVANVVIWGQRDQQLQVQVDPHRLQAADVSLLQVIQTTGNAMWVSPLSFLEASTPGTGGFIDTTNQRLGIQHVSPIVSPETLAQVTVEDTPDRVVHLGDVTDVVTDHQPLIGDAAADGTPGLVLVIEKSPGANVLEVTRGVDQALAQLAPGLQGLDVDPSLFRPATYVDLALSNVGTWLLLAAIALVLVLGLALFRWRPVLVSLLAILVSLVTGALVLAMLGATANAMVLAGLVAAVALVVDDAVAGVQQVTARLDEQDRPVVSVPTVVRDAVLEVRTAVVYPAAITVLVVLPVFFLDGQQRALYQPLALAYLVAIVASTVVALTLVPALYVVVGTGRRRARREPLAVRKLYRSGGRVVRAGLRRPRRVLVLAAVVALVGLGSVPFLTTAVLPTVQDPNLLVRFDGPPGTSLPEMDRLTAAATAELRSIPGVRAVGSQVGRAVLGDQVVSVNSAQMWVNLDPAADIDATTAAVRRAVHSYPGIKGYVSTAEAQTTTDILGAPGADLTVRLFGQDIGAMRAKAQEVRQMLSGVDGVVNPQVEQQVEKPTLLLDVDLAAADRAGIKPGDVRRAAATLLAGVEVGSLFQDQKIFEVVVKGTPETRQSPSSVRDLLIDTPTGGRVPLGDVAAVRVAPGTDVIEREDVSRRVDVTATVSGRSVGAVTDEVEQRLKQIPFPSENHAEVLGDRAEQQAGLARVLAVAVAALLGTFLLFQGAFASWRLATGMLLALPVALVGGVLAILLAGRSVSLGSLLGLLLVLGLAARNAVLLVRRGRRMVAEGEPFGAGLVLRATRDQAGPMLTTALATAAILTPALFVGAAGLEIVKPMAVAALGGLVTAVIVGLLAVPALYLLVGSGHAVHPDLDPTTD